MQTVFRLLAVKGYALRHPKGFFPRFIVWSPGRFTAFLIFFPHFNFMNHQPDIPSKSFRNEELLVFKKCWWYTFCKVNILIMNLIMIPLSKNWIIFHLLLQIYFLMFSIPLSFPGNWPAKIQNKCPCLWFPVGYRHRKGWPETAGRQAFIPPPPSSLLPGWLLPCCKVTAPVRQLSPHSSLSPVSSNHSLPVINCTVFGKCFVFTLKSVTFCWCFGLSHLLWSLEGVQVWHSSHQSRGILCAPAWIGSAPLILPLILRAVSVKDYSQPGFSNKKTYGGHPSLAKLCWAQLNPAEASRVKQKHHQLTLFREHA